jgi:hypothetical protein
VCITTTPVSRATTNYTTAGVQLAAAEEQNPHQPLDVVRNHGILKYGGETAVDHVVIVLGHRSKSTYRRYKYRGHHRIMETG